MGQAVAEHSVMKKLRNTRANSIMSNVLNPIEEAPLARVSVPLKVNVPPTH